MELRKGMLAISKAGHDKDSWYIIYNIEGDHAFLVNGTNRTCENPKKKKLKHLQPVDKMVLDREAWTNEAIKRAIKVNVKKD